MKKKKITVSPAGPKIKTIKSDSDLRIRMAISRTLKEKRKEHGLTQTEAGEIIGTTKTTYATWEQCRSMPDVYTLYRLAKFYGVTMDEMYGINKEGEI